MLAPAHRIDGDEVAAPPALVDVDAIAHDGRTLARAAVDGPAPAARDPDKPVARGRLAVVGLEDEQGPRARIAAEDFGLARDRAERALDPQVAQAPDLERRPPRVRAAGDQLDDALRAGA